MPFTATTREVPKGFVPPVFAPPPSLTAPTLYPQVGDRALDWALRGHGAVTRLSVTGSREQTPFLPVGNSTPGTDDPSVPIELDRHGRRRGQVASLAPMSVAAPRRLLRPRARGPMCRELHEWRYAGPRPDSQRNKLVFNHFFVHIVIHMKSGAWGAGNHGSCGFRSRFVRKNAAYRDL